MQQKYSLLVRVGIANDIESIDRETIDALRGNFNLRDSC